MFKKVLLVTAVTASLLAVSGGIASAAGADGVYGWGKIGEGNDLSKLTVQIENGSAHTGSNCLKIQSTDENEAGIYSTSLNLTEKGKYKVKFSLKADDDLGAIESKLYVRMADSHYGLAEDKPLSSLITDNVFTKSEADSYGWFTYESIPFMFNGETKIFDVDGVDFYMTLKGAGTVYADDIQLIRVNKDGNAVSKNDNLFINPGFEEAGEKGRPVQLYEPTNPMFDTYNLEEKKVQIGWINPTVDDDDAIKSIKVYEVTDDTPKDITPDNLEKEAGKTVTPVIVQYNGSGNDDFWRYRYYKIVFEFNNHQATEITIGGQPKGNIWRGIAPSWVDGSNADPGKLSWALTNVELDTEVKHSGNAALRINSLKGGSYFHRIAGGDSRKAAIPKGIYKVSFWLKCDDKDEHPQVWNPFAPMLNWVTTKNAVPVKDSEWKYYEYIKELTTDTSSISNGWDQFIIDAAGTARNVWIDDIEFYPIETKDSPVISGAEKLSELNYNGGFEPSSATIDSLTDEKATSGDESATISWKPAAATNSEKTNIYIKNDDNSLTLRASVSKFKKSVNITNLTAGKEYTFVLKSMNIDGRESAGKEVTVTPKEIKFALGEFNLNGSESGKISDNGTNTVSIDITSKDEYKAQLIVAAYDENGVLLNISTSSAETIKGGKKTLKANINTDEKTKTLKAFLWNSLDGMISRKQCHSFTRAAATTTE